MTEKVYIMFSAICFNAILIVGSIGFIIDLLDKFYENNRILKQQQKTTELQSNGGVDDKKSK